MDVVTSLQIKRDSACKVKHFECAHASPSSSMMCRHDDDVLDDEENPFAGNGFWPMSALPDGTYDVIVVDVDDIDDATVHIELVITAGDAKGDVVSVRGTRPRADSLSLLGEPGRLDVVDGRPSLTLDVL